MKNFLCKRHDRVCRRCSQYADDDRMSDLSRSFDSLEYFSFNVMRAARNVRGTFKVTECDKSQDSPHAIEARQPFENECLLQTVCKFREKCSLYSRIKSMEACETSQPLSSSAHSSSPRQMFTSSVASVCLTVLCFNV